jgi:TRAP-type C4-dicarboxylate transport system permease small subunit
MGEGAAMADKFQRIVAPFSKGVAGVSSIANASGTLMVLALVLVVNYDIVARGIFNKPFHGAVELVQFALVLIVFLQLPDVVRVGRLTRSDGFLLLMDRKAPRFANVLRRAIDALSLALMTLIAITIFPAFVEMWETNNYFGVPGVFTAPWWPIKLTILGSSILCAVIFAIKLVAARPEPLTNVAVDAKVSET